MNVTCLERSIQSINSNNYFVSSIAENCSSVKTCSPHDFHVTIPKRAKKYMTKGQCQDLNNN